MGFKAVYQSLQDVFPELDSRILKAVAIEHSKDADAAVEVILSEVLPYMSRQSRSHDSPFTSPLDSPSSLPQDSVVGVEAHVDTSRATRSHDSPFSSPLDTPSSLPQDSVVGVQANVDTSRATPGIDEEVSIPLEGKEIEAAPEAPVILIQDDSESEDSEIIDSDKLIRKTQEIRVNDVSGPFSTPAAFAHKDGVDSSKGLHAELDDESKISGLVEAPCLVQFMEGNVEFDYDCEKPEANGSSDREHHSVGEMVGSEHESALRPDDESKTSGLMEAPCLVKSMEGHAEFDYDCEKPEANGSSDYEHHSVGEMVGSEHESALSTLVTRSGQVCKIDLLEDIIEDAKSNKKTLFAAMEEVISMMREVEHKEKAVKQAVEEAANGGLDVLIEVEELKKMLRHAKEANDMAAGEVYGEKSVLATEARELQSRLLSLSDDRDNSLSLLNEMRRTLEERLACAEDQRKAAEEEKLKKEESAHKFLAEQKAIMEKVVQESMILQEQAEENQKLREFLMDRGSVVDVLQGEISVICQDVKLLKEKIDKCVPLSESLSSSQTTCLLASSSSSMKSMVSVNVVEQTRSPAGSVFDEVETPRIAEEEERNDGKKVLSDDEWEMFEKDALYSVM